MHTEIPAINLRTGSRRFPALALFIAALALLLATTGHAQVGHKNVGAATGVAPSLPLTTTSIVPSNLASTFLNCADQRSDDSQISSATFIALRSCSLYVSQGGMVTIIGSASLGLTSNSAGNEYEALFSVGIDSLSGTGSADRWVNTYPDSGDGSDKSIAVSTTVPIAPGFHTFYLLASRFSGAGTVLAYDSALSVVLVPASAAALSCGAAANATFSSASTSLVPVVQCSLTVAEASKAFMLATASVAPSSNAVAGEYEAHFQLSVDSTSTGFDGTDRWVNVYADSGDGVDETLGISLLTPVAAGTHTFYLLARRSTGAGTMTLFDPALSVIIVPDSAAASCGGSGNADFTSDSSTPIVAQQCTATANTDGAALIVASASPAMAQNTVAGETEWNFALAVDGTANPATDRWVNVYSDSGGDGNDRSMVNTALVPISAGAHTFSLLGNRYAGTVSALAYDPSIAVILLPPSSGALFANGFED